MGLLSQGPSSASSLSVFLATAAAAAAAAVDAAAAGGGLRALARSLGASDCARGGGSFFEARGVRGPGGLEAVLGHVGPLGHGERARLPVERVECGGLDDGDAAEAQRLPEVVRVDAAPARRSHELALRDLGVVCELRVSRALAHALGCSPPSLLKKSNI